MFHAECFELRLQLLLGFEALIWVGGLQFVGNLVVEQDYRCFDDLSEAFAGDRRYDYFFDVLMVSKYLFDFAGLDNDSADDYDVAFAADNEQVMADNSKRTAVN